MLKRWVAAFRKLDAASQRWAAAAVVAIFGSVLLLGDATGFVFDGARNLNVNCQVGCGSGSFTSNPPLGTQYPAIGTAPLTATGCTNVISSLSQPTVLVDANFISPTQLPSGASLEIFDESSAICNSSGTVGATIVLSTGQIGAGFRLGAPIRLSQGLSYRINNPGGFSFATGYGMRFRTVP